MYLYSCYAFMQNNIFSVKWTVCWIFVISSRIVQYSHMSRLSHSIFFINIIKKNTDTNLSFLHWKSYSLEVDNHIIEIRGVNHYFSNTPVCCVTSAVREPRRTTSHAFVLGYKGQRVHFRLSCSKLNKFANYHVCMVPVWCTLQGARLGTEEFVKQLELHKQNPIIWKLPWTWVRKN